MRPRKAAARNRNDDDVWWFSARVEARIKSPGAEVVNAGTVSIGVRVRAPLED